jgi:hypothetical protein
LLDMKKMQGWSSDLKFTAILTSVKKNDPKFMAILTWCVKGISMSRAFLVGDRVRPIIIQLCRSFLISFRRKGLMDIPIVGGSFTWSSNWDLPSWSQIDRFLVSLNWEAQFPDLIQKKLSRLCSDHFPILLDCRGLHGAKRYFKFKSMWLKLEGFVDTVRLW